MNLGFRKYGIWECIIKLLQAFQESLDTGLSHQAKWLCKGRESRNFGLPQIAVSC